jgi:hypothetical protein
MRPCSIILIIGLSKRTGEGGQMVREWRVLTAEGSIVNTRQRKGKECLKGANADGWGKRQQESNPRLQTVQGSSAALPNGPRRLTSLRNAYSTVLYYTVEKYMYSSII